MATILDHRSAAPVEDRTARAGRVQLRTTTDLGDDTVQVQFPGLGTTVHLVVVDPPPDALQAGRRLVDDLEEQWSRFRTDSDITRLNHAGGTWVSVGPATLVLLDRARTGWAITGGLFDPTVLPALVEIGYDVSFEHLPRRIRGAVRGGTGDTAGEPVRAAATPGLGGLDLDWARSRARLAPGVAFDPGGIGKGLAADLVVDRLLAMGSAGALANLGGDLRAAGAAPGSDGWGVEVVAPGQDANPILAFEDAAVATSTPLHRRWEHRGRPVHHLIDPTTGRPASAPAVSATVVAGAAWLAEVLATSLALGGLAAHLPAAATGLVCDPNGQWHDLPGIEEFRR